MIKKMLKQQLKNSKKAKYEMGNFCEQYDLPPITPSKQKGKKKHDKVHKDYKYKRHFTKPNDFYAKKKNVYKKKAKMHFWSLYFGPILDLVPKLILLLS